MCVDTDIFKLVPALYEDNLTPNLTLKTSSLVLLGYHPTLHGLCHLYLWEKPVTK